MKKLLSLLVIGLVVTGFSSCKKDKKSDTEKVTLAAKWDFAKVVKTTYGNGVQVEQTTDVDFAGAYAQFNSNGTGRISDKRFNYLFTYTFNDNTLTLANLDFNADGTVDANEGVFTTAKVIKLTRNELVTQSETSGTVLDYEFRDVTETYYTRK